MLPLSQEDFELFQKLLVETCGLLFEEGRNQSLHLALWQRLQHRGYNSYSEYYHLLKFHPEGRQEIRELLDVITIGETYFFRNKAQFDALMKSVLPEIIRRKIASQEQDIRVWSAGCSRGDEPYSIAIAIKEVLPSQEEWGISILGTDINRKGLAYAKEASYEEKDIRHLPKEYLKKYFKTQGSAYILNPDVRELVRYEYHNLIQDSFLKEKMQHIDLIFCRNVTIYFNYQMTRRVIENFYNSLIPEGFLFLGHTETLWQITDKFETVEFPQTFVYRKKFTPVQQPAMKPFMAVPEMKIEDLTAPMPPILLSRSTVTDPGFGVTPTGGSTADHFLHEPMSGIKEQPGPLSSYLASAILLANEAKYKEAADILRRVTDLDNLSVEAYYLLGVLSYKAGDLKEAETHFRKLIYVTPESALAYFNLGNIYLYQGKFSAAAREFKNAIRLSEKRPKDEQIRFCEDFTVDFLLRACRNNLSEISERATI